MFNYSQTCKCFEFMMPLTALGYNFNLSRKGLLQKITYFWCRKGQIYKILAGVRDS